MKEFVLFAFLLFTASKTNLFALFLGESMRKLLLVLSDLYLYSINLFCIPSFPMTKVLPAIFQKWLD